MQTDQTKQPSFSHSLFSEKREYVYPVLKFEILLALCTVYIVQCRRSSCVFQTFWLIGEGSSKKEYFYGIMMILMINMMLGSVAAA